MSVDPSLWHEKHTNTYTYRYAYTCVCVCLSDYIHVCICICVLFHTRVMDQCYYRFFMIFIPCSNRLLEFQVQVNRSWHFIWLIRQRHIVKSHVWHLLTFPIRSFFFFFFCINCNVLLFPPIFLSIFRYSFFFYVILFIFNFPEITHHNSKLEMYKRKKKFYEHS